MLPSLRNPHAKTMTPVKKARTTARSGLTSPWNCSAVMRDMMAVGPTVMSFELPNTQYTKQPMKLEYRPY